MNDLRTALASAYAADGPLTVLGLPFFAGNADPKQAKPYAVSSEMAPMPTDTTFGAAKVERPRVLVSVYDYGMTASGLEAETVDRCFNGLKLDLGGGQSAGLTRLAAIQTVFDSYEAQRAIYRTILIYDILLNRN